jgi:hypothetical protein
VRFDIQLAMNTATVSLATSDGWSWIGMPGMLSQRVAP